MLRPRRYAVLFAVVALVACGHRTVNGAGTRFPTATPTPPLTATTAVPAPTTSAPTPTSPTSPTSSAATTPTSAAPTGSPRPPECPTGGACTATNSISLAGGYTLTLYGNATYGGSGASILELRRNGVSVDWRVQRGETPARLGCADVPALRCIVVDYVGAHGALARLWAVSGNTLTTAGTAAGIDTPNAHVLDLNGDGYVDLAGLQNNYTPDYATGKVQWQTWVSNGATLTSTGCGPQGATMPPTPTAPQTGPCGP